MFDDDVIFFLYKCQTNFDIYISKCTTCIGFYNKYINYFFFKKYYIYTSYYTIYIFNINDTVTCIILQYSNIIAI